MTTHGSLWRTDVARNLANDYRDRPGVRAVLLGGSTARGQADRYSDLELGVFWDDLPSEAERAEAIAANAGDLHLLYPLEDIYLEDCFFVGRDDEDVPKSGQLVELTHLRTADLARMVDQLDTDPMSDPVTLNLLSGLVDGIALAGSEWLDPLAAHARSYPDPLRDAVIRRHGAIEFFWRWEMLLARGSQAGPIQAHFWSVQQRVLQCLLAVNGRYPIGEKFLGSLIDRCVIAPTDFAPRFLAVQSAAPAAAADILLALVDETYDLIADAVPGLSPEIDAWRHFFHYRRPCWTDRPPRFT